MAVARGRLLLQSPSHKNKRQQQELIQELKKKQVKDSRHVYEGKDGAIEDIITGTPTTHTHTTLHYTLFRCCA